MGLADLQMSCSVPRRTNTQHHTDRQHNELPYKVKHVINTMRKARKKERSIRRKEREKERKKKYIGHLVLLFLCV